VTSAAPLEPIHPDRFEREMVIGWNADASVVVAACTSTYPGRRIVDASVSVVADGWQRSVHRSGRLAEGPLPLSVDEPALSWRAALDVSRSAPAMPSMPRISAGAGIPGHHSRREVRRGVGAVDVTTDGFDRSLSLQVLVIRSEGVEPIDPAPPGAPYHELPQELWWLAVLDVDGPTLVAGGVEDEQGRSREGVGTHALRPVWAPGSRRLAGATLDDGRDPLQVTPLTRVDMGGLGFTSATWPHGAWHDEAAVGVEAWRTDRPPANDVFDVHHGYVVTTGDGRAAGWLEVVAVGPHRPSGLTGFTDGYAPGH
jgi:hypothetical protein